MPRRWRCSGSSRRASPRLRVPSPGINGFEPEWFLLILAARVFGRGFGFVLGAVAFFASALITGGVGPVVAVPDAGRGVGRFRCRLPASDAGLPGAAAAGRLRRGCRRWLYGLLINFWFWPFVGGSTTTYSFVPGLGTFANLHRFILFDLTTSLGFDLTRAATCAVLILVLGRPVLAALRRASRRAAFEPQIDFVDQEGGGVR